MFKLVKRRLWKGAVIVEFEKMHGFNLRAVGDIIGPGTLDDLLNSQYEENPRNPTKGASYVTEVLEQSFGIDVGALATQALFERNRDSN